MQGNNGIKVLAQRSEPEQEYEGQRSAKGEDGFVKATKRIPFPKDGPTCNYAALFDETLMFDGIRRAFMTFADPFFIPIYFYFCV